MADAGSAGRPRVALRRWGTSLVVVLVLTSVVSACGGQGNARVHATGPGLKPGKTVPSLGEQVAAQPRVAGRACPGGFDGGEFLIVRAGATCALARTVGRAVLETSGTNPTDAMTFSVRDPTTGRLLTVHCGYATHAGPDKCVAGNGASLYLFASKAPV